MDPGGTKFILMPEVPRMREVAKGYQFWFDAFAAIAGPAGDNDAMRPLHDMLEGLNVDIEYKGTIEEMERRIYENMALGIAIRWKNV